MGELAPERLDADEPGKLVVRHDKASRPAVARMSASQCPPEFAVRAGAEKRRQILVNLLSYTVKFADAGRRIKASCAAEGACVAVRIRDTEIGIPADKRGRSSPLRRARA